MKAIYLTVSQIRVFQKAHTSTWMPVFSFETLSTQIRHEFRRTWLCNKPFYHVLRINLLSTAQKGEGGSARKPKITLFGFSKPSEITPPKAHDRRAV